MQRVGFFVLALLALSHADPIPQKPLLNGVTVLNAPYVVSSENNTFSGFAVDLLNKIAEKAGFDYKLSLSPDGKYGAIDEAGNINGMLGEVKSQKADFAIADITVTDKRKEHITFTDAFQNVALAGVGRKQDLVGINNLEELIKKNEEIARSDKPQNQIKFSFLKHGSTGYLLNHTSDPIGQAIFKSVSDDALVLSNQAGFEKAAAGGVVHLTENSAIDFLVAKNCDLVKIPDNRGIGPKEYAIAVPKGSAHLDKFNQAIRDLKADGTIAELQKKYWANTCA